MSTNKDGLDPNETVEFETIQRVEAERRRKAAEAKQKPKSETKPTRNTEQN